MNEALTKDAARGERFPPVPPSQVIGTSPEVVPVAEMGVPYPDGAGGLVLPPPLINEASVAEEVEEIAGRREFPNPEADKETLVAPIDNRPSQPHNLLPEIGRLAREIVRTGEEKVAVAVGAYNSVRLSLH